MTSNTIKERHIQTINLREDFDCFDALPDMLKNYLRNSPFKGDAAEFYHAYYHLRMSESEILRISSAFIAAKIKDDRKLVWNIDETSTQTGVPK